MAADWHLKEDERGDVFLVAGTDMINLGPRDEVVVRFADFFGDDHVNGERPEEGFVVPESLGATDGRKA